MIVYCNRCGIRVPEGQSVSSKFTGNHYCIDIQGCSARVEEANAAVGVSDPLVVRGGSGTPSRAVEEGEG